METSSFMMLLQGQLADMAAQLGTMPSSLAAIRAALGSAIPADSDGTFIFFNPETGSIAYAKDFIQREW
jgi:hypothetical protein